MTLFDEEIKRLESIEKEAEIRKQEVEKQKHYNENKEWYTNKYALTAISAAVDVPKHIREKAGALAKQFYELEMREKEAKNEKQ